MKKLRPVHDKIVVKSLEKDGNEDVTESGIILPDSVSVWKLLEGKVISVSDGAIIPRVNFCDWWWLKIVWLWRLIWYSSELTN